MIGIIVIGSIFLFLSVGIIWALVASDGREEEMGIKLYRTKER